MISVLFLGTLLAQQPDYQAAKQREEVAKLSFIVGEWEGKGWFAGGPQKTVVDSYEKVELKAGGTALFITGLHRMTPPGSERPVTVHDAAAMLYYDLEKSSLSMRAQLASGAISLPSRSILAKGFPGRSIGRMAQARLTRWFLLPKANGSKKAFTCVMVTEHRFLK